MSHIKLHVSPSLRFIGCLTPFDEADYVVLGVPFDTTSTYRRGSRFGPQAIREASQNLEAYSVRAGLDGEDLKICDAGDLHVLEGAEETLERLQLVLKEVIDAGKFPVVLGGEHTITYGAVRAFGRDTAVLNFDAHMDLKEECLGSRLSHVTFMRRISEVIGPKNIIEVGVRAFGKDELQFAKESGLKYVTGLDVHRLEKRRVASIINDSLSSFKQVYLTLDMDVIDPSYAPAVGNPVPEGMSPRALLDVLQLVCNDRVVGLDLVEVSPHYDTGLTAFQASHLICETLCFIEKTRSEP